MAKTRDLAIFVPTIAEQTNCFAPCAARSKRGWLDMVILSNNYLVGLRDRKWCWSKGGDNQPSSTEYAVSIKIKLLERKILNYRGWLSEDKNYLWPCQVRSAWAHNESPQEGIGSGWRLPHMLLLHKHWVRSPRIGSPNYGSSLILPFSSLIRISHSLSIPQICELEEQYGVTLGPAYMNNNACKGFVHYIAESNSQTMITTICNAQFFSLHINGSSNKSNSNNELVISCLVWSKLHRWVN